MASASSRQKRLELGALLAAALVTNIAYTILIPYVPHLERNLGLDVMTIGGVFAGFALAKMLFQPFGGILVDRAEARQVAIAGLMLSAVATFWLGFAQSGTEFILLRLLWGIGEGIAAPALYRLCFAVSRDSRIMGWFGSAEVAGMAVGPALVGLFHNSLGFTGIFILASAIIMCGALILAAGLPHHARSHAAERKNREAKLPFRSAIALVVVFGLVDLVSNIFYAALEPALPLFLSREMPQTDAIAFLSWMFFTGLIVFSALALFTGSLIARLGVLPVTAAAFAFAAVGFWLQATATTPAFLFAGFILFMLQQPLVYVASRTAMRSVPERQQGRAFGFFGCLSEFGWVAGPMLGVALVSSSWPRGVFILFAAFALAGSIGFLITLIRNPDRSRVTGRPYTRRVM
jgi:MFS family permease